MNADPFQPMIQQALQHYSARQFAQAEQIYRHILASNPNHPDALGMLGVLALMARHLDQAEKLIRRSLEIDPHCESMLSNLGIVYRQMGRMSEAIDYYRRAVAISPNRAELLLNLAGALRDTNQLDEAAAIYERILAVQPDFAEAHIALSSVYLLRGDFARGWPESEWRLKYKGTFDFRLKPPQPRWNGESLQGKTILLHSEQGFGDTIHFIRYAPLVAQRGGGSARVIVACQPPLTRLLERCVSGVSQWVSPTDPLPAFDVHCPLPSLAHAFGTTLESIPPSPMLEPEGGDAERWREKLSGDSAKVKVGLCWSGNPWHINDSRRSIPVAMLAPLGEIPGVSLYSVQKSMQSSPAAVPVPFKLIDHTAEINDFGDSAAMYANLDLVISVDTSVAHLAGAMSKPTWVLLPKVPDWRWMLEREDSPWYPSMRLFRQGASGDWAAVIQRVKESLTQLAASR